jgi:hypothetical protein
MVVGRRFLCWGVMNELSELWEAVWKEALYLTDLLLGHLYCLRPCF